MKKTQKRTFLACMALLVIITIGVMGLSTTGCDTGVGTTPPPSHTHQWGAWTVTKAATCTAKGEETHTCTLDSTHKEKREIPIDPAAHVWGEWEAETKPTCTEIGIGSRICKLNASHKEKGAGIPALGHDYENVKTVIKKKSSMLYPRSDTIIIMQ